MPRQSDKLLLKVLWFQAEANGAIAIFALLAIVVMMLGYFVLTRV